MELSPKAITGVEFRTVRKGYDPDEVRSFLAQLARGVEAVQTQAATSDQRARAAIAKLQEQGAAPKREDEAPPSDQASRLLVLAQKTADTAGGQAEAQAQAILSPARGGPPNPPARAPA